MRNIKHSYPEVSVVHALDPAGDHAQVRLHTHASAELYCLVSGSGVYYVEGSAYRLQPGDLLLMRPGEAHYIETDPDRDYERIYVNFDTTVFASLDPEGTLLRPLFDGQTGKGNLYRSRECLDCLQSMVQAAPGDRLTVLANLLLLLRALGRLRGETPAQPDTMEYRILRYIHNHLDQPLTIEALCDRFYMSRAQLCRRVQKATGTSVGKYIAAKRLITAQSLLRQGQKPTEVFAPLGYGDYSTFYRAYKARFGYGPGSESRLSPVCWEREEFI